MNLFIYDRDDGEEHHHIMPRREWYGENAWRDMMEVNEAITEEALRLLGYSTQALFENSDSNGEVTSGSWD